MVTAGISSPTAGTNAPASPSSGNGSPSLPSQGGSPSSSTGNSSPGDVGSTGQQQCCDSIVDASDPSVAKTLSVLNVNVQSLTGLVGLNCSPIIGQAECGQRVRCEHVIHDSLISLECVHVAL
ncbi:hypothetical protein C8Q75DRAFT_571064 [Abortiporus biennis]|nr:hypothetical protein C8Q75DRAFT_571064 [Abortiporus biennis]